MPELHLSDSAHSKTRPRPQLIYGTRTGLVTRAWTGRNRDTEF